MKNKELVSREIKKSESGQGGSPDFLAGARGSVPEHGPKRGRKIWGKADAGQNRFFSRDGYKFYGIHACLSLWKRRPLDIIRVYVDPSKVKTFGPLLEWCAEQKKAYHIIPQEELDKVSDSVHHEGVCILAKELLPLSEEQFLASLKEPNICLLYLDGVENPHNVGSILRTAAHFGIPYILGEQGKIPSLSPSTCRIAKGAAETVRLVPLKKPLEMLKKLMQKGFQCVGTSSHKGQSLYKLHFPARTLFVLGSESHGLSPALQSLSETQIQIPGSGEIESLNVSVAASLCMGEYCRQRGIYREGFKNRNMPRRCPPFEPGVADAEAAKFEKFSDAGRPQMPRLSDASRTDFSITNGIHL